MKNGIGQAGGSHDVCKKHGRRLIRSSEGPICVECAEKRAGGRDDPEHRAQCEVIRWRDAAALMFPEVGLLHAIPNGGKRDIATARRMKAEGVVAGIPDLFLPVARKGYHGLYIEMKADGGRLTPAQLDMISELQGQNYRVMVCYSADAAIMAIEVYLGASK